jgi:general stress protein 26
MTEHPENYEDVTIYGLDQDDEQELLTRHNECTFIWSNKEGWPVGVIMSFIWRDGFFWLTASAQRARIAAVRRDPRVCIVVTSTGSPLPRNKTVTWKGTCEIIDDRSVKDWFYRDFADALMGGPGPRSDAFVEFLDSPRRVVLKVSPTQRIGYDGTKMFRASNEWIAARNEDGGSQ